MHSHELPNMQADKNSSITDAQTLDKFVPLVCRLENEHLNNAGKFRAVKTVPLPFHEVDEED